MINATHMIERVEAVSVANEVIASRYTWVNICRIDAVLPWSGVAALVDGQQIAIFRLDTEDQVYAVSNYDPFSKANVMSRGLVGDRKGIIKVASPIYKQSFSLETGQCLDDPSVTLATWSARVVNRIVQLALA